MTAAGATTKRRRVPLRRLGFWYGLAACIIKPLTWAFMKKDWRGLEHVPREGGVILAVNHISHADPIAIADYIVYGAGRPARFLALTVPGGLLGLYDEVGVPATELRLPGDDGLPMAEEIARWNEVGPRYGLQVVGPPIPE